MKITSTYLEPQELYRYSNFTKEQQADFAKCHVDNGLFGEIVKLNRIERIQHDNQVEWKSIFHVYTKAQFSFLMGNLRLLETCIENNDLAMDCFNQIKQILNENPTTLCIDPSL